MSRDLEAQVLREPGRGDPSEPQLRKDDRAWEGSGERNRGSMNKNRIRGDAVQGERAKDREALATKGRRRKSGDRAVKATALIWGDLGSRLKGRRR